MDLLEIIRNSFNPNVCDGQETEEQKMDQFLEQLKINNADSSFDQLWVLLVKALKVPNQFTTEQKIYAVGELILKDQTEIIRFFPIAEFFDYNTKHMIEVLQKISGKEEVTEFRFLKEDSLREKKTRWDWNDAKIPEEVKSDLKTFGKELWKMKNLHTLKIDAFSFDLSSLEDLCHNLKSLRTVEVVINQEISFFHPPHLKKIKEYMGHLKILKFNGNIRNLEQDNIPHFEKNLDEFFIRSILGAKIIGQPGRFIDIQLLVSEMEVSDKSNLTHIAHKMWGDATLEFGYNFPHLDQLEIDWSEPGSDTLSLYGFLLYPFPKLTQLTLTNIPDADKLRMFVDVYKKKQLLSDLTVNFKTSEKLSMISFDGLSKTLRKLVVREVKPIVGRTSVWSLESFQSLTELEIKFAVNSDARGAVCVVPICSLFLAPNLEKVKLYGQLPVDVDHLQDVHDQIVSENILKKVTRFEMKLLRVGSATCDLLYHEVIERKEELCSSIVDFYESKGVNVIIGFVYFCRYV
ncbi:Hypothetical predicted protein [Cloeon dipterum]|uniref:Uncharacterized protein n=1 Tax=Cloeon dipterum TaxID=197152 RepID=A0A8S1E1N5_9INSE|nr:Hypothetical predicted protein [Cloeon dipterum]